MRGDPMRYRWLSFALLVAAVVAGLPFVQRAMVPDNALTVWFVEDDPLLAAYRAFHEQFGNDEFVLVGYRNAAGLLRADELAKLRRLTGALERLDGVARVYSLTNARDLVRTGNTVRALPLVPDTPAHLEGAAFEAHLDRTRAALRTSPLVAGRLLDSTATTALVWVQMDVMDDLDRRRGAVVAAIRAEADRVLGPGRAHLGGLGVIYAGLDEATRHDFGLFFGLTYVVVAVVLYVLFRRVAFVVLALGVVFSATLLALAACGLAGRQINMVTVMLPTLVTVLGLADVVHLANQYAALPGTDRLRRTRTALLRVWRPCLYTTLTTAAGFLSLVASDMQVLKDFGLFAAVGIGAAFVATFVLGAVVLPFVRPKAQAHGRAGRLERLLEALPGHLWRRRVAYAFGLALLAGVALAGYARVEVDTYTLGYLPGDHRVVRDHAFLERYWGPYATLELTVRPTGGRDLRDPAVLRAMQAFSDDVVSVEGVHGVFGLHTVLAHLSEVVYRSDRLLRDRQRLDPLLRVMARREADDLRRLASEDYRLGRLTLTGEMMSAQQLKRALADVEAVAARHFEGLADVRFAGYPPLYVRIIDYVMQAQVRSFYLALVLIFALMLVLLRSVRLAVLAMAPNVFPVLLMLGFMGFAGIPLDVATATVAAIVLGVAIDDTIHLLYHYRRERRRRGTADALARTFARAGRAVVVTSVLLALGFAVLMGASVQTVFYFGLLTVLSVAGALVGDLVLLPLLVRMTNAR